VTASSCAAPARCVVLGTSLDAAYQSRTWVESLTGSVWTAKRLGLAGPHAIEDDIASVSCRSLVRCVAVGSWVDPSGNGHPLAELLNLGQWQPAFPPAPTGWPEADLYGVSCITTTHCVAVGEAQKPGGLQIAFVDTLNSTKWSVESIPLPPGAEGAALASISCNSQTSCHAAGYWIKKKSYFDASLAVTLDGNKWLQTELPVTSTSNSEHLTSISCATKSSCVAVGSWGRQTSVYVTGAIIESLSGTTWKVRRLASAKGTNSPSPTSVSCPTATDCVAVGMAQKVKTHESVPLRWRILGASVSPVVVDISAGAPGLSTVSCAGVSVCRAFGQGYPVGKAGWQIFMTAGAARTL
jgi:hypothetical protein